MEFLTEMLIAKLEYKQTTARNISQSMKKFFKYFNLPENKEGLDAVLKLSVEDIKKFIKSVLDDENSSENTKRTLLQRVFTMFKNIENINEEVLTTLGKVKDELNTQYNKTMGDNKMSEKEQKITKVSIADLQQAYDCLKKQPKNPQTLQDIVILSLYVNRPPLRLDYANTIVVSKKPKSKEGDFNYLFIKKTNMKKNGEIVGSRVRMYFYLNQDKVMGKADFRPQIYEFLNPLKQDIMNWIAVSPNNKFLLLDDNGNQMNENQLGKRLNKITKSYTGTALSNTDIRKIFINELHKQQFFIDMSEKEKSEYASKNLRHSLSVERNVYIKKN